ncbi:hypothetical protein LN040_07065 [Desulfovibrio subterraneus]|uniref:hypothetical protein n=1 Tax=Desulfovibrio subterraneus TaxID=2718620 RepID=UPI0022B938E5|nr:hypothetical protein [Desulfovibrio subterraneus]WBF68848.1 hypothetical protein LN040_07065 [Desulfovibrio subterraneus]
MERKCTTRQSLAVIEESNEIRGLLLQGFSQYANMKSSYDSFDACLSNIALGVEKLSKLIIVVEGCWGHGVVPDVKKEYGHSLLKLKNKIIGLYDNVECRSAHMDKMFLEKDKCLHDLLEMMQEFLYRGRFDNLNAIIDCGYVKVKDILIDIEIRYCSGVVSLVGDNYEKNRIILGTIERYVRALVRLVYFDCVCSDAKRLMTQLMDFLIIDDVDLGLWNYGKLLKKDSGDCASAVVTVAEKDFIEKYGRVYTRKEVVRCAGDERWPFVFDDIIVECRRGDCALVVIDGFYYALNGRASTVFDLSFARDAGLQKIGLATEDFIKMAFGMWPVDQQLEKIVNS